MNERRQRLKQKVFLLKESLHFSLENGLNVDRLKGGDSSVVVMRNLNFVARPFQIHHFLEV